MFLLKITEKFLLAAEAATRDVPLEKLLLGKFAKFTGKYLCQSLFFNKLALKKRPWHRYFPVNFAKFLRTPFLKEHLWMAASVVDIIAIQ